MNCVGIVTVVKFFKNERIRIRLMDKVYYPSSSKIMYKVIFKEGKYLTLENRKNGTICNNVRLIDIEPITPNTFITRSLGKIGVIDSKYQSVKPKVDEFWLVKIVEEIEPGRSNGCFVLEPLKHLYHTQVDRLIPGMYSEKLENDILYIYPKTYKDLDGDDIYWILPMRHRKGLEQVLKKRNEPFYATIISHNI